MSLFIEVSKNISCFVPAGLNSCSFTCHIHSLAKPPERHNFLNYIHVHCLRCLSFCLSFFLPVYISDNIMYVTYMYAYIHVHVHCTLNTMESEHKDVPVGHKNQD